MRRCVPAGRLTSAGTVGALSGLRSSAALWIAAATVASSVAIRQTGSFATRLHLKPLHCDDWAVAAGATSTAVALLLATRAAVAARARRAT
jgi:hypothetical protein